MADVTSYEARMADIADQVLALAANIERLTAYTWNSDTGAGYEGIYNPQDNLNTPGYTPAGANMTQSQMNNLVSALNAVKGAIEGASAPLAIAAEWLVSE